MTEIDRSGNVPVPTWRASGQLPSQFEQPNDGPGGLGRCGRPTGDVGGLHLRRFADTIDRSFRGERSIGCRVGLGRCVRVDRGVGINGVGCGRRAAR